MVWAADPWENNAIQIVDPCEYVYIVRYCA
jgi:hypothetical protein